MSRLPARIDDLPASMVDIAETLGLRVALSLIQSFGGRDVKFPVDPAPDHPIIKALGENDGRAVCRFLGGDPIYIPHARPRRSARADILRLERQGMDRAAIASELGISTRWVRSVANRTSDPDQPDLFDSEE